MALSQLTERLGVKRAAHLLRRTCLGATKSQIEAFAVLTPQQAIEELFGTDPLPSPEPPVDPATGNEWVISGRSDNNSDENDLIGFWLDWKIGQMLSIDVETAQSLSYAFRERLVFFLHTHFTTKRSTVNNSRAMYFQDALFRMFAFDREDRVIPPPDEETEERIVPINFQELAKKVCVDNAMLRFLDGRLNVKDNPNENFARELLELYTVGRGLETADLGAPQFEGDYLFFTEEDVQQGALVLSGFNTDFNFLNIDPDTDLPRGVIKGGTIARQHDNGIKAFSFRLSNGEVAPDPQLLAGSFPTEESALDEISQLIDLIFDQSETALHIMRKLYRFFVYHDITEELQNTVLQDLADIFVNNDYKLQPVLEALFTSRHFYDAEAGVTDNNFGGIIKSPVDIVVGFARTFEIPITNPGSNLELFYEEVKRLRSSIADTGDSLHSQLPQKVHRG
ncbi:MAG: DUF1800 family protein [Bacteroidota bacterium]